MVQNVGGVGAKCVNALPIWFKAEIYRDGKVHYIEFEQGKTTKKLDVIGKTKKTGTKITFLPDPEIFTVTTEYKFEILHHRLRELAFLNPGITIVLTDEREDGKSESFFYKDGIVQFVKQIGVRDLEARSDTEPTAWKLKEISWKRSKGEPSH